MGTEETVSETQHFLPTSLSDIDVRVLKFEHVRVLMSVQFAYSIVDVFCGAEQFQDSLKFRR